MGPGDRLRAIARTLECDADVTEEGLGLLVFRGVARPQDIAAVRDAGFEIVRAAAVAAAGTTRLELYVRLADDDDR